MKRRPVLKYPNPRLRKIAESVPPTELDARHLDALFAEMAATMHAQRGIGLAATQIDVHRQMVVIELEDGVFAFCNPSIRNPSKRQVVQEEGCLSVPGVFGLVNRAASLTLIATDKDGKPLRMKADGLFARVIQHELDHLNGKLFLDRCHQLTTGLEEAHRLKLQIPPISDMTEQASE